MASPSAPAASPVTHLPPYFPLIPRACADAARPFFECFSEASVFDGRPENAGAGRAALALCGDARLADYIRCAEKHLTTKQTTTWAAPDSYINGAR